MKLMWPQSNILSQGKLTAASGYQQKEAIGYFVLADFVQGQAPHALHLVQTPPSRAQADLRKNQSCTLHRSGAAHVAGQHGHCALTTQVATLCLHHEGDMVDPASQAHTVYRHNSADLTEALASS